MEPPPTDQHPEPLPSPSPSQPGDHPFQTARNVNSTELFGHDRELVIHHEGSCYRLRITKSGKLILTK